MKMFFSVLLAILIAFFIIRIYNARIIHQQHVLALKEAVEYSKGLSSGNSREVLEEAMHRIDQAQYNLNHE